MPAQEDHERFSGIADELGLEDDDRESFITSAMKRLGYKPRMAWDEREDDGGKGKDDGDFFTRRQKRETRQVRPERKERSSGSDWQYGS